MWVSTLEFNNIKSFAASETINLSKNVNVLLGANNSGKSVIIKVLYLLQKTLFSLEDIRIGQNDVNGFIRLEDVDSPHFRQFSNQSRSVSLQIFADRRNNNPIQLKVSDNQGYNTVTAQEPQNFIYPYLSKRKVTIYRQDINISWERGVLDTLENLVAKVDRLANPYDPHHKEFEQACSEILGFPITTFQSGNGKQAGIYIDSFTNIPLESMGEGVPNLLGLIVNLCMANNQLFLIEEIENDVQPLALKSLLELVARKAQNNQFVISTHSHIVTTYLGAVPESKVFETALSPYTDTDRVPTSTCNETVTSEERRAAIKALGYELDDYGIAKGWLFFEESSAEQITRDFLIPWFAARLRGRIRTVAAQGTSDVEPRFKDFNRLFLFLHLQEMYKNCAWVIVDGESSGREIITKLKDIYIPHGWTEDHFLTLAQDNFECYYPEVFHADATAALSIRNKKDRKAAKEKLLEEVLEWIVTNEAEAKAEFEKSAHEVIDILRSIETILFPS
jgi:AAA ATPase-like protein